MNKIMRNEPNLGQSQIVLNLNENNKLQRKNEIGHLVKTNPNEANFWLFNFPFFPYNKAIGLI